jgi:hypothetical protein
VYDLIPRFRRKKMASRLCFVVGEYEYGGEGFNIYDVIVFQDEVTEADGIAIIKRDVYRNNQFVIRAIGVTELRPVQRTVYQSGE